MVKGFITMRPWCNWALTHDGACSWTVLHEMAREQAMTPAEERVIEFNRRMDVHCRLYGQL